jgi:two-component system, cell cycle response regulator
MARLDQKRDSSGKTILLVDDHEEYRRSAESLLKREGHAVITAASGEEAIALLRQWEFDLLLMDYYMPGGISGEDTVREIRKFNPLVQVILQTGYAGDYPPREMLRRLDIQGYYDKTEGPEKLLLWVDVGLKSSSALNALFRDRQGLRFILDATEKLHEARAGEDPRRRILQCTSALLGVLNNSPALLPLRQDLIREPSDPEGFLATAGGDGLRIMATTERFLAREIADFPDAIACAEDGRIRAAGSSTAIPLRLGDRVLGVVYLERPVKNEGDLELVQVFANQAAVALRNAQILG